MNAATAPTEPVVKTMSTADAFKKLLDGRQRDQIAKQLPKGIDCDRFIRTAQTVVAMNPELLTCTLQSLLGAIMTAAKDGLLPDGKEALIQVYNCNIAKQGQPKKYEKQAQYLPMVRGLISILYRSGGVALVDGVAVRQKDHFRYVRGDSPLIEHEPYMGLDNAGPIIASYCIIKLTNGEVKREVMNAQDLAAVRSMAKSTTAWSKWEDQFVIKAVIKRAWKQLPTTPQLEQVIQHDNLNFDLEKAESEPVKVIAKAGEPSRLKAIINTARETVAQTIAPRVQPVEVSAYFGDDDNFGEPPAYDR